MLESFFKNSSLQDLSSYLIISMIIFGLSPYGLFIIRLGLHHAFGAPRPRIIRGARKTPAQALQDVSTHARERIEEMHSYIADLEELLAQSNHGAASLEAENEALKEHIRAMEVGAKMHGARYDDERTSDYQETSYSDAGQPGAAFEALDLQPGASWEQIRAAYRRSVKVHHPDHRGDPEAFKKINEAYEQLRTLYGM